MHGLVNRTIQCFVEDTYDAASWDCIVRESQLGFRDFEAMLTYPDDLTDRILAGAVGVLGKTQDTILEDIGTYLVCHPTMTTVRRLLRFGGHTFEDFLHSLDDLPDRVKLAIPDLEMPRLTMRDYTRHQHTLTVVWKKPGFGSVFMGLLRALADDYGTLVLLDLGRVNTGEFSQETIRIELLEIDFAVGRAFSLGGGEAA